MERVPDPEAWLENADGGRFPIAEGFSIGRGSDNQLVLLDDRASRRHALVHDRGKDGFWLVDLGSRNGTYRNNRRLQQPVRLRDGDRLRIGSSTVTFREPGSTDLASLSVRTTAHTLTEVRSADCWLLIADLIGSTQRVHKSAPEEASALTSRWLQECRQIVETTGGTVNKFLGDGFLAFWLACEIPTEKIVECIESLRVLQQSAPSAFRFVVHRGHVLLGGTATLGEESLSGPEVNFTFRMEKLAGSLGECVLLSETASGVLKSQRALVAAGEHTLSGFEGRFPFFVPG